MNEKVQTLQTCNLNSILGLMKRWGYAVASDPGYRKGDLWWAGFSKGDKSVYAWEVTANWALRQAAIDAVKELE